MWPTRATLSCGAQACDCNGFSCCGARALGQTGSVAVIPGLQSTGSGVVVHGLSCSMACGIFPEQGLNLCLLHRQVDYLPLNHQESPPPILFIFFKLCHMACKILVPQPGIEPEHTAVKTPSPSHWTTREVPPVKFSHSVVSTLWDPMDCSRPGLPVHHQLPRFTKTHVH